MGLAFKEASCFGTTLGVGDGNLRLKACHESMFWSFFLQCGFCIKRSKLFCNYLGSWRWEFKAERLSGISDFELAMSSVQDLTQHWAVWKVWMSNKQVPVCHCE